jgi:hypothetical protein
VNARNVDVLIFIPLIPAIPVIAFWFLPWELLDSEDSTRENHRSISALLCIRYLALQTTVVDHFDHRVGGNCRLRCGDFRPEKSEKIGKRPVETVWTSGW